LITDGGSIFRQATYGNVGSAKPAPIRNSNKNSGAGNAAASTASPADLEDTRLKSLLREIREAVGSSKRFWSRLPQTLCEEETKGSSELNCWNGRDAGKYSLAVVGDGFHSQVTRP
jgi:hypothetical protein